MTKLLVKPIRQTADRMIAQKIAFDKFFAIKPSAYGRLRSGNTDSFQNQSLHLLLVNKFQRMRRKRHRFIYEIEGVISKTEAKESIDSAKKLIERINEIVKGKRGGLFDLSQNKPE